MRTGEDIHGPRSNNYLAHYRSDCRLGSGSDRQGIGFGLIGNIVVGIVGAVIAGWLLQQLEVLIGGGILAAIINAIIGAVILLVLVGMIRRTT